MPDGAVWDSIRGLSVLVVREPVEEREVKELHMIRFQRSAMPRIGKQAQAITWAKVFAEFVTEHYGVAVQIFVESTGKIHWITDYPSYEAYGKVRMQIVTDRDYWGTIGRSADLFIEGSMDDVVLQLVD